VGIGVALAEVFSPVRCAGCDLPGAALCPQCVGELPLIDKAAACPRCGADGGSRGCAECRGHTFVFERAVCAGRLEPPLSRAITLYKDAGERRYAALLGGLVLGACGPWHGWSDAVCAIPPSREALARRGFDHTRGLATALATAFKVPVVSRLAVPRTRDQRALGREERFANMRDSFRLLPGPPLPRRILIVDDVLTTGATLDGAARVLLDAGAEEIRVATVARA
jgi:predicted amidophosphoribosyltransferase